MKELTTEQKAQRYDEAVEKAKDFYKGYKQRDNQLYADDLESIFPELKESEDERIRNALIEGFKVMKEGSYGEYTFSNYNIPITAIIAWLEKQGEHANFLNKIQVGDKVTRNQDGVLVNLSQLKRVAKKDEKQGEQKSNDKVEFEIGDLITNGILVGKIDEIHELGYHAYFGDHYADVPDIENWHKWTIEDAKDGDVVADGNLPFIFKKIDTNKFCYAYCGISADDGFKIKSEGEFGEWTWMQDIKPATKEQRDTLMKAMTDAGYKWDAENRQLRKIESRQEELTEFEKAVKQVMEEAIECGDTHNLKADADMLLRLVQKSSWSEKDEEMVEDIIEAIDTQYAITDYNEMVSWLKSLKDRYTWKPSDEQMVAVQEAMNIVGILTITGSKINSLYQDLKKLKEK